MDAQFPGLKSTVQSATLACDLNPFVGVDTMHLAFDMLREQ